MAKLTALDFAFFILETQTTPMHVGPLIILKPPKNDPNFARDLITRMSERPVGPPFNWVLRYSVAGPVWKAVDDVDLHYHTRYVRLAPPGNRKQLTDTVCELHYPLLDHSRPLWEFYVIDGLQNGQFAIYLKFHHSQWDGITALRWADWWLAKAPDGRCKVPWEGRPKVAGKVRPPRSLLDRAGGLIRQAAGSTRLLKDAYQFFGRQAQMAMGKEVEGGGLVRPFSAPHSALDRVLTSHRSLAFASLPLSKIKAIGRTRRATVNDVMVTLIDIAVRRYLDDKGEPTIEPLQASMAFSLHGDKGRTGNLIAALAVALGARDSEPLQRLEEIKQSTRDTKNELARMSPEFAMAYSIITNTLAQGLDALHMRDLTPNLHNLLISNPYGFPKKKYFMGAAVERLLPVSTITPGVSLNVTILSYGSLIQVGFLGVRECLPMLDLIPTHLRAAFREMERLALKPKAKTRARAKSAKNAGATARAKGQAGRTARKKAAAG